MRTDHSRIFFSFSKNPETPSETAYGNSTIHYVAILITLLNGKII